MIYTNVQPIIGGKLKDRADIEVLDGKISRIAPLRTLEGEKTDLGGGILAPGYIDIHTHGGNGHDFMEADAAALRAISDYHLGTGTTSYCPTTLTASIQDTVKALDILRHFSCDVTARRLGAHLEGPFISPKAPGAHPPKYILDPNEANTRWIIENKDVVARITVAPDNSGAPYLTRLAGEHDIQVSLGHDASIDDEIYSAVESGASSVTHMYNCTSRPSRRTTPRKHLGLTEVGLICDKLRAEVIADDRHVPNSLFGMILKLKGADGIILVSDSLAVAGVEDNGALYLGSGDSKQHIEIQDGVAVLPHLNTYAGSVTPISKMVINIVANLSVKLEDAVKMGTINPARLLGLTDRGDIKEGMLADFNVMDNAGNIKQTILGGKFVG